MNSERTHRKKGFSITELLIVLSVILVLVGGTIASSNILFPRLALYNLTSDISLLKTNINEMFRNENDYSELTSELLINADLIPKSYVKGSTIVNGWGGDIEFTPSADRTFTMKLTRVPQSECQKLADFQRDSWQDLRVNGKNALTLAEKQSTCREGGRNNTIEFVAR